MTLNLPDLNVVLREQYEANEIMLKSKLRWVAVCSGCGNTKITDHSNGMPAAHQLREIGWRVRGARLLCPGCALDEEDLL